MSFLECEYLRQRSKIHNLSRKSFPKRKTFGRFSLKKLSEKKTLCIFAPSIIKIWKEITKKSHYRTNARKWWRYVHSQNNKEKWVAFVGLLDGYPYEIFTGLQDDEEGIVLPKTVTHGKIIKQVNPDGTKRYDFQFENKRGYKTTVEGLSEKFNPEYWNYAKLISGVLRYRMPLEHVIRLVASLSLKDESINTWKVGVERALKKYLPGSSDDQEESQD